MLVQLGFHFWILHAHIANIQEKSHGKFITSHLPLNCDKKGKQPLLASIPKRKKEQEVIAAN